MASTINSTKTTIIDGDRFAASLSDPKVAALIDASCAYGDSLAKAGRDHSLDPRDRN